MTRESERLDDDRSSRYWSDDRQLSFDEATDSYRLERREGWNPVVDAILAVARIDGVEPLEMSPLYEELSPDVVPRVVAAAEGRGSGARELTFRAYGHSVCITATEVRLA